METAARLAYVIDGTGARTETRLTGDEMARLANQATQTESRLRSLTAAMNSMAPGGPRGPRGPRSDRFDDSIARMRREAARPLDLGLANQIALLDPFQDRLAKIEPVANRSRLSLGRLGNQFAGLAGSIAGVHPVVGNVMGVMGNFAIGSAWTVGILAGIAAISVAWSKVTEKTREAGRAQDEGAARAMAALRMRALGAGGQLAEDVSGAAGRISDLEMRRREASTWFGKNLMPGSRAKEMAAIDTEIGLLRNAIKQGEQDIELAIQRRRVEAITTPYGAAMEQGRSVTEFYGRAAAAQKELADLAKSGTHEVKMQAIGAMGEIQRILDAQRMIKLGLADAPGRLLGLPEGMALGGMRSRVSDIGTSFRQRISQHGEGPGALAAEIEMIGNALSRANDEAQTRSGKNAIAGMIEELTVLHEAIVMAESRDRPGMAARIREGRRITSFHAGALESVQNQRQYGEQLAGRERALQFPPAFDAAREAVVRHGEAIRDLTQEYDLARQKWTSLDSVIGNVEEGLRGMGNNLLQQFSPANIAGGLLGGAISTVTDWAQGVIEQGSNFIKRSLFGSSSEERAAAADARKSREVMKLTMDSLRASIAGDSLGAGIAQARQALIGLLSQIDAALPGTKNEAERDRTRAEAEALSAQEVARMREADARRRREQREDLEVRLLRAQGRTPEAEALAFRREQEREYADAVLSGADAAYLASLTHVQAAERVAQAMGTLQDAVRNAPTGFTIEAYGGGERGGVGDALPIEGPWTTPTRGSFPDVPRNPAAPPTAVVLQFSDGAFILNGNESPEMLVRKMLRGARSIAAATTGPDTPIAQVFDLIPSS